LILKDWFAEPMFNGYKSRDKKKGGFENGVSTLGARQQGGGTKKDRPRTPLQIKGKKIHFLSVGIHTARAQGRKFTRHVEKKDRNLAWKLPWPKPSKERNDKGRRRENIRKGRPPPSKEKEAEVCCEQEKPEKGMQERKKGLKGIRGCEFVVARRTRRENRFRRGKVRGRPKSKVRAIDKPKHNGGTWN